MAEIINLNRVRKQRGRAEKSALAEQNRVAFGRTKAERDKARSESEKADRDLAGHKIDRDGE